MLCSSWPLLSSLSSTDSQCPAFEPFRCPEEKKCISIQVKIYLKRQKINWKCKLQMENMFWERNICELHISIGVIIGFINSVQMTNVKGMTFLMIFAVFLWWYLLYPRNDFCPISVRISKYLCGYICSDICNINVMMFAVSL